jgi:hypothetical protein
MRKPSFSFAISSSKENDQITSLPHTPLPLLEKFVPLLEIVSITILVCQFYVFIEQSVIEYKTWMLMKFL